MRLFVGFRESHHNLGTQGSRNRIRIAMYDWNAVSLSVYHVCGMLCDDLMMESVLFGVGRILMSFDDILEFI